MTQYSTFRVTANIYAGGISVSRQNLKASGMRNVETERAYANTLKGWQNHISRMTREFLVGLDSERITSFDVTDEGVPREAVNGSTIWPTLGSDTAKRCVYGFDSHNDQWWVMWITVEMSAFSGWEH